MSPRQVVEWDIYFMNIAHTIKTRSKDPKIQVGAVLVSIKDNRIISTGYNSLPAGVNDNLEWGDREMIRERIIHAESNAVLYAQSKFEDAKLYTTLSPCIECLKLLSACKIKKIIYENVYKDIEKTEELCKYFNIEIIRIKT